MLLKQAEIFSAWYYNFYISVTLTLINSRVGAIASSYSHMNPYFAQLFGPPSFTGKITTCLVLCYAKNRIRVHARRCAGYDVRTAVL